MSHYEVALLIPELRPDRLSPADHIAAEVRFAAALERACEATGGIISTYTHSMYRLDAWAEEEITGPDDEEPGTPWKAALRAAETATWAGMRPPAGAEFTVRVHSPEYESHLAAISDVPF